MSESKHTPGPWKPAMMNSRLMNVLPHRVHGFIVQIVGGADGQMVAHAHGRTEKECEANARLIAAAPDMLEALQGAAEAFKPYDRFKVDVDAMRKLEAAIAKAHKRAF